MYGHRYAYYAFVKLKTIWAVLARVTLSAIGRESFGFRVDVGVFRLLCVRSGLDYSMCYYGFFVIGFMLGENFLVVFPALVVNS